jgi:hypothetical protein
MSCKNKQLGTDLTELSPLQLQQVARHVFRKWELDVQTQLERRRFSPQRRNQSSQLRK